MIAAWFIAEFVKRAPFGTGVAAILEPAPTWQVSQEGVLPVGRCLLGKPTIAKPDAGIAKVGAFAPWQVSQPPLVVGA